MDMASSYSSSSSFSSSCSSFSSEIIPKVKYDVWLRCGNASNSFDRRLASVLHLKGVKVYVDDSTKMENNNTCLWSKVIPEAKIAVVSLSEDFANSEWNLEQLNHIVESKQKNNQTVIPVFHHVDRTHVQQLTGKIGAAFAAHEVRFTEEIDKVHQWKNSLRIVANQPGWDVPLTRAESKAIEEIVNYIVQKLREMSSTTDDQTDQRPAGFHVDIERTKNMEPHILQDFIAAGIKSA